MAKFQELGRNEISIVKEFEYGLNETQIKEFFLIGPGGGIFIKKAGLYYKLNKKYGTDTAREIKIKNPSIEEFKIYLAMQGLKEGQPFACFKATLKIREDYFEDMGTAHPGNCFNKSYLIEMASTRAILRTIRQATDCNFCSVEEIWDSPEVDKKENTSPPQIKTEAIIKPPVVTPKANLQNKPPNYPSKALEANKRSGDRVITEPQRKRMFAKSGGNKEILDFVVAKHGFTSSKEVTMGVKYDAICAELETIKISEGEKKQEELSYTKYIPTADPDFEEFGEEPPF